MIAAYVRVLTKDQNPDLQRVEICSWAKANGIEEVIWYEDRISGDKSSRPRLDALRKDIFAGKVKTVILWELDRLARSKRDGETLLADWCGRNLRIVSVTQKIDLSGVIGQIVASVLLGLGEIELSNIRERQAAGVAVARKKGIYQGRKSGTTKAKPARAHDLGCSKQRGNKGWCLPLYLRILKLHEDLT